MDYLGSKGRKYFDVGLFILEIAETLLQSYLAYRVSRFIARRWINRLYVCTITLSCWAIVAIHFVYRSHASKRRLMCLMFDCVLDLVSSIFLPGATFYIYLQVYDPVTRTITRWRWYDDSWLVSIWSEYQLVLADSWSNLLNRLAFSFGLLVGMQGVKELLRSRPPESPSFIGKTPL